MQQKRTRHLIQGRGRAVNVNDVGLLHAARVTQHHETPMYVVVDGKEHEIFLENVDALRPLRHALVRFFLSHVRGLALFVPDVRELLVEKRVEDVTPLRHFRFHFVL